MGPSTTLPRTILGIFKLFLTTALVTSIVEQTNTYACQMLGEAGSQWEEVISDDIWAFLGFCIMVGINKVPALHQYWSSKDMYYNKAIASRIPRDRFFAILRYLHFVENRPEGTIRSSPSPIPTQISDRLWKVRPVITV